MPVISVFEMPGLVDNNTQIWPVFGLWQAAMSSPVKMLEQWYCVRRKSFQRLKGQLGIEM